MPDIDWELRTNNAPTPPSGVNRIWYAIAYSPLLRQVLLFGGNNTNNLSFNDAWIWDDIAWTQTGTNGGGGQPAKRDSTFLAWDATNEYWILYGGEDLSLGSHAPGKSDTWTTPDGITWTNESPAHNPGARVGHGMAYCAASGKIILFGGSNNAGNDPFALDETWSWDGTDWTQEFPATTPPARGNFFGMCESGDNILMYGGATAYSGLSPSGDTWIYDGTDWTEQFPSTSPPTLATVPLGRSTLPGIEAVLFGGITDPSGPVLFNTDTYTWDGSDWTLRSPVTTPDDERGWTSQLAGNPGPHLGVVLFNGLISEIGDPASHIRETWTSLLQPPVPATINAMFGLGR